MRPLEPRSHRFCEMRSVGSVFCDTSASCRALCQNGIHLLKMLLREAGYQMEEKIDDTSRHFKAEPCSGDPSALA